jgi:hypothetical protein
MEDEMGGVCCTNEREEERQWERDHQEDQDVGGWIILRWIWER